MRLIRLRSWEDTTNTTSSTHTHGGTEGTAPETSINPRRFSVAQQLLLSPGVISTEHSLWITERPENQRQAGRNEREQAFILTEERVRTHTEKKKMEQWRLPVQKAWLREWRRLIRVIQTAFITFSAGKWEAIYFYNLAYIYAELSLCILPGPHFHSVMSVSAGWTQYRLIRNYLHFWSVC